jgi:hypothetical protein
MDISENLDRGIDPEDHWLSLKDFLSLIGQSKDVLPPEGEEGLAIN